MTESKYDLAWNLYMELRKEIVQAQQNRDKILEVKIVFIGTATGVILGLGAVNTYLLVIPAFAAIFFDLLLEGISRRIRTIGGYCRTVLEPVLKRHTGWSDEEDGVLWECHMHTAKGARQPLSTLGNIGLTTIMVIVGLISLFHLMITSSPAALVLRILIALTLIAALILDLYIIDVWSKLWEEQEPAKEWIDKENAASAPSQPVDNSWGVE